MQRHTFRILLTLLNTCLITQNTLLLQSCLVLDISFSEEGLLFLPGSHLCELFNYVIVNKEPETQRQMQISILDSRIYH